MANDSQIFKYNTAEYYTWATRSPALRAKLQRGGWKSLTLKDWHLINFSSLKSVGDGWPNPLNFTDIALVYYAPLIKSEKDLSYCADVMNICGTPGWLHDTITYWRKCLQYARSTEYILLAIYWGFSFSGDEKTRFHRTQILNLLVGLLRSVKDRKDFQRMPLWVKITMPVSFRKKEKVETGDHNWLVSLMQIAETYGCRTEVENELIALMQRVFEKPSNIFSLYTKDAVAQGKVSVHDVNFLLITTCVLPFIESQSDDEGFKNWLGFYHWEYATKNQEAAALRKIGFYAKTENEIGRLLEIAPNESAMQKHALESLRIIRSKG